LKGLYQDCVVGSCGNVEPKIKVPRDKIYSEIYQSNSESGHRGWRDCLQTDYMGEPWREGDWMRDLHPVSDNRGDVGAGAEYNDGDYDKTANDRGEANDTQQKDQPNEFVSAMAWSWSPGETC
jgi:hypothetical protein